MRERGLLGNHPPLIPFLKDSHPAGGIFARCYAVAHIDPDGQLWLDHEGYEDEPELLASLDMRWWMGGYALVLADIRATPFAPCRGYQGLWNVPDDVLALLEVEP